MSNSIKHNGQIPAEAADNQGQAKSESPPQSFPVVGLGASAGGLKALLQFFELMPASSGMAFVVIMHLSPKHESHSADLLQKVTKMPVTQVNEPVRIEPDHVYVIPPTRHLQMLDSMITLKELPEGRTQHVAVDLFFRTLADAHRDRAVGIVLSGTGSDGTTGLKRIKEQGGLAIAQSPNDAEYDGMPRNAIGTGMVDFVLPVTDIPDKLVQLWQNASVIRLPEAEEPIRIVDPTQAAEDALREILILLHARTGHDFRHYKRATVLRRIERRMQVTQQPDLPAYFNFLREHQDEPAALLKDMLISVTNFFRDREAFEALEREVIPSLFAGKTPQDQVRVWVPGCASGEEAFSIAILLAEYAASITQPPGIQVFATDLNEQVIATAREGSYPESILTDISPTRLRTFFTKDANAYKVKKAVRERVLFAAHNALKDPPFSRLDLISCRNLMIYLNREVQEQMLALFHFALRPDGYLFLGSSESTESAPNLFAPLNKKHRLFKANVMSRQVAQVPTLPLGAPARKLALSLNAPLEEQRRHTFGELHQRLLEQYAPPSVIVNQDYYIVHLSDRAGRFLQFVGGEPSHNLLKVIHPELRLELRTALFQTIQTNKSIEARRVRITREGRQYYVNMICRPVKDPLAEGTFIMVVLDEVEDILGTEGKQLPAVENDSVVHQLEAELHRTKELLQTTIEQYEASNEELKASNEEFQAINEELRSMAEEMETSKEELQSINEEMTTVNAELNTKMDEVISINNDLKNLISSTDIATVFVDRLLRVRRYTPRAVDLFNLIQTDVGRSLLDITHRLVGYKRLADDTQQVMETLLPLERELESSSGRWYLARMHPYRTLDDHIDGVVLAFIDITERKRAEELARETQTRWQRSFEVEAVGVIFFNTSGQILNANDTFLHMSGYSRADLEKGLIRWNVMTPPEFMAHSREAVHEFNTTGRISTYEKQYIRKDGSRFWALFTGARLDENEGVEYVIDITERKERDELLRESEAKYRTLFEGINDGFCIIEMIYDANGQAFDYRFLETNPAFERQSGLTEATGKTARAFAPHLEPEFLKNYEKVLATGEPLNFEIRSADLARHYNVSAYRHGDPQNQQLAIVFADITERKRAEEAVHQSEESLRLATEAGQIGTCDWNYQTGEMRWNDVRFRMYGLEPQDRLVHIEEFYALVHPDDRERVRRQIKAGVEERGEHAEEYRIVRPDGTVRWIVETGRVVEWRDDQPLRVSSVLFDVTEQHAAEGAIRASEERLRLLVESVKDYAIITFDTELRITGWNAGAQTLFGYTSEEMIGQAGAILFTPEDRAQGVPEQEAQQALATGRATDERWHLRKDGTRFYASGVLTALRDGSFSGFVKITRDLTARKLSEEDLRERRKELEVAVQARTLELSEANQSLQHEVGERRGAEERVKDLLRTIITAQEDERQRISRELHDHLGQLLTALQLNLETIAKRSNEKLAATVAQAQAVTKKLDDAVDFLAWELRPAALEDVGLSVTLANYVMEWGKHFDIEAEFHGNTGSSYLRLEPEFEINLYRIAQEALNNIAKHAQAKNVDVLLERRQQHLVLIIEDDGIGFEPDGAAQPRPNDRGLGLIGMGERAALIGGTAEIESTPGSGTTVFVRVPLPESAP